MKLTITQVDADGRIKVMSALRHICHLSLQEAKIAVDSLPFIREDIHVSRTEVMNLLHEHADFTYMEEYIEGFAPCPCAVPHDPEHDEYMSALKWLDTLSVEDQNRVRCIVRNSMPRAPIG